jgi:hypothetical protein
MRVKAVEAFEVPLEVMPANINSSPNKRLKRNCRNSNKEFGIFNFGNKVDGKLQRSLAKFVGKGFATPVFLPFFHLPEWLLDFQVHGF